MQLLKRLVCLLVKLHFTIPCISTDQNKDSTYSTQKTNSRTKSNTYAYSFLSDYVTTNHSRAVSAPSLAVCFPNQVQSKHKYNQRMQFKFIVLKFVMKMRYAAVIQHSSLSLPRFHKKRKPFRSGFRKWISSEVKTHDVPQGCEKQKVFLTRDCELPFYITL